MKVDKMVVFTVKIVQIAIVSVYKSFNTMQTCVT